MHVDPYVALAGLLVGFTVGLTGMGGGALMTPILVLLFRVQPLAAVSSDLVAAMVMKPIGGGVHVRQRTVNWELVRWLCLGSIPSAFLGVLILKQLGNGQAVQDRLKLILGIALLVAASSMVLKAYLQGRQTRRHEAVVAGGGSRPQPRPFRIRKLATVSIGAVGGLLVGMTSVGSGSLIIVCMLLLYPTLRSKQLVGTDLVQAIPLVASAAVGHILFGDFEAGLTTSVLLGSLPGVYLGAKLSSRAPDGVVRPALIFVLLASSLKLLEVDTVVLGWVLLAVALLALPIWGALDAFGRPVEHWTEAGQRRGMWVRSQLAGAPFGIGFVLAIVYFVSTRPKLMLVSARAATALEVASAA